MGASTCKACGLSLDSILEFGPGVAAPKLERDQYRVPEPALEGLDPLGCGDLRYGPSEAHFEGWDGSEDPRRGSEAALGTSGRDAAGHTPADSSASFAVRRHVVRMHDVRASSSSAARALGGVTADGGEQEPPGECGRMDILQTRCLTYFVREDQELKLIPDPPAPWIKCRRRQIFRTGAVYDGEWLGNQRNGFGILTWRDGARYLGQWRQNRPWQGQFRHCNGDVYVGQWRQNKAHGLGRYLEAEGVLSVGSFSDDLHDGVGVERWPDGSTFMGQLSRGRKSGYGVYVWPDGSRYEGQWSANQMDGYGTWIGMDGRLYGGEWRDSQMHGWGQYSWPDGRTYAGQYRLGLQDGLGSSSRPAAGCGGLPKSRGLWRGGELIQRIGPREASRAETTPAPASSARGLDTPHAPACGSDPSPAPDFSARRGGQLHATTLPL